MRDLIEVTFKRFQDTNDYSYSNTFEITYDKTYKDYILTNLDSNNEQVFDTRDNAVKWLNNMEKSILIGKVVDTLY